MADQAIYAPFRVFDGNGDPVPGAKAAFYLSGTLTLIDVYEDDAATILSTNPVIADANGALPQRFFNGQAKVVITTADDVEIATLDPVAKSLGDGSSASNVSFAPSASLPVDNVQSAVEMVDGKVADLDEALGGYLRFDAAQSLSGPEQTQGRDNLGLGTLATVSPTGTPDGSKFLRDDNVWTTPVFTKSFASTQQVITSGGLLTLPHGMGVAPKLIQISLKITGTVTGFTTGDEVFIGAGLTGDAASNRGASVIGDATNVLIRFGSATAAFSLLRADTGAFVNVTNTEAELIVRAWA